MGISAWTAWTIQVGGISRSAVNNTTGYVHFTGHFITGFMLVTWIIIYLSAIFVSKLDAFATNCKNKPIAK